MYLGEICKRAVTFLDSVFENSDALCLHILQERFELRLVLVSRSRQRSLETWMQIVRSVVKIDDGEPVLVRKGLDDRSNSQNGQNLTKTFHRARGIEHNHELFRVIDAASRVRNRVESRTIVSRQI